MFVGANPPPIPTVILFTSRSLIKILEPSNVCDRVVITPPNAGFAGSKLNTVPDNVAAFAFGAAPIGFKVIAAELP